MKVADGLLHPSVQSLYLFSLWLYSIVRKFNINLVKSRRSLSFWPFPHLQNWPRTFNFFLVCYHSSLWRIASLSWRFIDHIAQYIPLFHRSGPFWYFLVQCGHNDSQFLRISERFFGPFFNSTLSSSYFWLIIGPFFPIFGMVSWRNYGQRIDK